MGACTAPHSTQLKCCQSRLREGPKGACHLPNAVGGELAGIGRCGSDNADVGLEKVAADLARRGLQVFLPIVLPAAGRVERGTQWVR